MKPSEITDWHAETQERAARAVELFRQGYNCAQSVTLALADLYDMEPSTMARLSGSFGGGIGRMRQTCGAACGLFMLAGLETGCIDGKDREGKEANYKVVQALAEEFKKRNGSLICAELLGLSKAAPTPATPEARTAEYYKKRPCVKMVEEAARIWCEYLANKGE